MVDALGGQMEESDADFSLTLRDYVGPYFEIDGQPNPIQLTNKDAETVPRFGFNTALVGKLTPGFNLASRDFFAISNQPASLEIPMVKSLTPGELAVVLTWSQGTKIAGTNILETFNLDLHVEFQPEDKVLCTVDHSMRQCNGVRMTTDNMIHDGLKEGIQAAKFDYLGDFTYIVYASKSKLKTSLFGNQTDKELTAKLQIYSPMHDRAVYEVAMPFMNEHHQDKYWVAFCIRGGQGINQQGISIADPGATSPEKPTVYRNCVEGNQKAPSINVF
jgi:hypothetical protein